MPYFLPRYHLTVSVSPPNNNDCREQVTHICDPEKLAADPKILAGLILDVMCRIEARLEREGAVLDGPVIEINKKDGSDEWPRR